MPFFQPNVGGLKAKGDVRRLCEIAQQDDLKWETRRAAAAALSELATDDAIPCLVAIATWSTESAGPRREVGSQAESSLVAIARGRPEVTRLLAELAKGVVQPKFVAPWRPGRERAACVRVLGELGTDEALAALSELLRLGLDPGTVVAELSQFGERATEGLAAALASHDPQVVREAAAALEQLGWRPEDPATKARLLVAGRRWREVAAMGADAVPALADLAHGDEGTADKAVEALIKIRTPESSQVLVDRLTGRIAVIKELARRRHDAVIPALVHELDQYTIDDDPELRTAVIDALAVFGDKAVPPLIELLAGHAEERASAALRRIGAAAIPALAARFYDGGWLRRTPYADVLVAIRPEDELLRAQALVATTRYDQAAKLGPVAREPLQEAVERFWDQPEYSLPALKALARIPGYDPAFVDRLAERRPDWGPRDFGFLYGERFRAAEAYVRRCRSGQAGEPTGDEARVEEVERVADGRQEIAALRDRAKALEAIRWSRSVVALAERLADPDAEVRLRAESAVGEIADATAIAPLQELLGHEDVEVVRAASRILTRLGDPRGSAWILIDAARRDERGLYDRATRNLERAGSDALSLLGAAAHDESAAVRWSVAHVLGRTGAEEAVPLLVELLDDADEGVRDAALAGLQRIGGPDAEAAIAAQVRG